MVNSMQSLLARNAVVDGFEFIYPAADADFRQALISGFLHHIAAECGMTLDEARKCCKIHVLSPHIHRAIPALKFVVWGKAAEALHSFDSIWYDKLTELHLKTYLVSRDDDKLLYLRRTLLESKRGINCYQFNSKESNRSKKSSGEPGVGIGSKKSAQHGILYRRKYQHHGIEIRIQGPTLKRHITRAKEQAEILEAGDRSFFWASLCTMAGLEGFGYINRELNYKGARLEDYFSHVQARPWADEPRNGEAYHRDELPTPTILDPGILGGAMKVFTDEEPTMFDDKEFE